MIGAFAVLLLFQLIGEVAVRSLAVPIPGPVVGMLLLFGVLMLRGGVPKPLQDTAQGMLQHLALLFVPAGVGVMAHAALLRREWLTTSITIVASTLITLLATAATMRGLQLLVRRSSQRESEQPRG